MHELLLLHRRAGCFLSSTTALFAFLQPCYVYNVNEREHFRFPVAWDTQLQENPSNPDTNGKCPYFPHSSLPPSLPLSLPLPPSLSQIIGLALIGVGIWLIVEGTDYSFITDSLASPAALLIVAGVVTVVISIVGIVGALGMWYCVLVVVSWYGEWRPYFPL